MRSTARLIFLFLALAVVVLAPVEIRATVSDQASRNDYTGNGTTTIFPYTFKIFANTDLKVIKVSVAGVATTQTLTTHYTVSGVGGAGGGNVTFVTAPAAGERVVILRNQPYTQGSTYILNEGFPSSRVEKDYDKLQMQLQQQREKLGRALKFADSSLKKDYDLPEPQGNTFLAWDPTGAGLVNSAGTGAIGSFVPNSYTQATLPATCTDNSLVVVSDGTRGLRRCKGNVWIAPTEIMAEEFGILTGNTGAQNDTAIAAFKTATLWRNILRFNCGTYTFTSTITLPLQPRNGAAVNAGGIRGCNSNMGTIIQVNSTAGGILVNDGVALADSVASYYTFEGFELRVPNLNAATAYGIKCVDPCNDNRWDNVVVSGPGVLGGANTGVGVLHTGETSCTCHNHYGWGSPMVIQGFSKAFQLSGFANANKIYAQVANNTTAYDFTAFGTDTAGGATNEIWGYIQNVTTAVSVGGSDNEFHLYSDTETSIISISDGNNFNKFYGYWPQLASVTLTGSATATTFFFGFNNHAGERFPQVRTGLAKMKSDITTPGDAYFCNNYGGDVCLRIQGADSVFRIDGSTTPSLYGNGNNNLNIGGSGTGNLVIKTDNTERWQVTGSVSGPNTGFLIPRGDNMYGIGTQSYRPTELPLSAPAITPGTGTIADKGSVRTLWYKKTVSLADMNCIAASTTCNFTVATLPAKTFIKRVFADLTQVYACAPATCTTAQLTGSLGYTAGSAELLVNTLDLHTGTTQFGDADAELGSAMNASVRSANGALFDGVLTSWSATTTVIFRITSGTGNLGTGAVTNLSTGSMTFYLVTDVAP